MNKVFKALDKLSDAQKELISEIERLKRDLAFKKEELQAMYLEHKGLTKKIDGLAKENNSLKQKIEQQKQEEKEMLLYP